MTHEAASTAPTTPSNERVVHPVAKLLHQRRSEGSRPGRRQDDFRVALAIEGGGLRGVVSGGMVAALEDLGFRDTFDAVYGSSAGAFNATYFLTGQAWEALPLYYDEMTTAQFFDLRRVLRGRPPVSLDWALEVGMTQLVPLDWSGVISSDIPLNIIASSITDLRPVVFSGFSSVGELKTALKASARIPMLAGPPVEFRNHRLLDAAVLQAHPYESAIADQYTHVLSLSTRPEGRLRAGPGLQERLTSRRLEHLRRGLGDGFLERIRAYRRAQAHLRELSTAPYQRPFVLDVAPASVSAEVKQIERNAVRILAGARDGYQAIFQTIQGVPVRAFYRLTTSRQDDQSAWPSR